MLVNIINFVEKYIFPLGNPTRYVLLKLTNGNEHLSNLIILYLSNFIYALTTPYSSFFVEKNITGDLRDISNKLGISLSFMLTLVKLLMSTTKLFMIFFSGYIVYKSRYYTTPIVISQLLFCFNLLLVDIFAFCDIFKQAKQGTFYFTIIILSIAEAIRDVGRIHLVISTSELLYSNMDKESISSMNASLLFLRRSIYQLASSMGSLSVLYLVTNHISFLNSIQFLYKVLGPVQIIFVLLTISFSPSANTRVVENVEPTIKKYYNKIRTYVIQNGPLNSFIKFLYNTFHQLKNYIFSWGSSSDLQVFSVMNCILVHIFCSVKKNLLLYITLPSNTSSIFQNIKLVGQVSTFLSTTIFSFLLSKRLLSSGFVLNLGVFMVSCYVLILYSIMNNVIQIPSNFTGDIFIALIYSGWLISVALINSTISVIISDYWSNQGGDREFFSLIRYLSLFVGSAVMQGIFSLENVYIGYAILAIISVIMFRGILFNYLYINKYIKEK